MLNEDPQVSRAANAAKRFEFDFDLLNQFLPYNIPDIDRPIMMALYDGETQWANLGLWGESTYLKTENCYPAAAESLARKLGKAAQLGKNHSVYDAGFGGGEQFRLWRAVFKVGHITGRDICPKHVELALQRIETLGIQKDLDLNIGDAARPDDLDSNSFDRVVSLDAAYHFKTREDFLKSSFRILKPGGRIAFTDLLLPVLDAERTSHDDFSNMESYKKLSWKIRGTAKACGIVTANLITNVELKKQLQSLGYEDIKFQNYDEFVWSGFIKYIVENQEDLFYVSTFKQRLKIIATVLFCKQIDESKSLNYILISASKPN